MQIVDRFKSQAELLQFRDHLGKVMAEKMSIPLKQRKLDELVSQIVGAKDFNTAMAMVSSQPDCIERLDSQEFEIMATLCADDDSRQVTFDAGYYLQDMWAEGSLTQVLKYLLQHGFSDSYAADECARHIYQDHEGVREILDYCADKQLGWTVTIEQGHVQDWLTNQRLYVLALWVEANHANMCISDFCEQNPQHAEYLRSSKSKVPGFGEGPNFTFVGSGKKWSWIYKEMSETISSNKDVEFLTKELAFANFLDYFMSDD